MGPSTANRARSAFSKWLREVEPYPLQLAWCHTADAYALRTIIHAGELRPRHCKVFQQELLYFFYGRPAFRRQELSQVGLTARAPISVIFSPGLLGYGVRLYPFDSGAFEERYKPWMHHSMALADFEIDCEPSVPQRHVAAFFASNTNYLKLLPQTPPKPYVGEFEVESIVSLLNDPSAASADDRRLAMEMQVSNSVPFSAETVLAMIVPDELLEAPWFLEFVQGQGRGIDVVRYELAPLRLSAHYQALLEERAVAVQQSRGML